MTLPTSPDDPVAPWDATVAGVADLLPDAKLYDTAEAIPAGRRGVTRAQVRTWLVGLSGRASIALDGWEKLSTTVDEGAELSDRDRFADLARDAVHNGAASYVEAARFPEAQGKAASSYAAVLWARYEATLADLGKWLELRLADPLELEPEAQAAATVIDYSFPPVSFTPWLRF